MVHLSYDENTQVRDTLTVNHPIYQLISDLLICQCDSGPRRLAKARDADPRATYLIKVVAAKNTVSGQQIDWIVNENLLRIWLQSRATAKANTQGASMTQEHVRALEDEVVQLKEASDALYRQHANEKAQMQIAIEQEKLRFAELMQANDAYREENEQWRVAYEQLESSKREGDEGWESERKALEEKVALLEESMKSYSSELVTDLEELEKEKHTRRLSEETVAELQKQINESNERFLQLTTEYDNLHAAYQGVQNDKSDLEQRRWDVETQSQHQVKDFENQIQSLTSQLHAASQVVEVVMEQDDHSPTQEQQAQQQQVAEKDDTISQLNQQIRRLEEEVCLLSLTCGGSAKPGAAATGSLRDLQQHIFEKSEELVRQGEKNLALAEKYERVKSQWHEQRSEVKDVRLSLLRGVAGSGVDDSLYQHVKLEELIRLRLKALEHEWLLTGASGTSSASDLSTIDEAQGDEAAGDAAQKSTHLANVSVFSTMDGLGSIGRLERELRLCRSRNKRLQEQTELLERELQTAMNGLGEFQALKEKAVEMVSRERVEKELRQKSEANCKETTEKIVALSEHIEKLMVHLKHEAAAKTKAVDSQRRTEKEFAECRDKSTILQKKTAFKDQQIQELEQGAKILEDQLRLMDEKFIEVRNKLDWTRATSQKETKKLNSELTSLRMKWQMASDAGILASLPDWASVAKMSKKSRPLGSSSSDSRLPSTSANGSNNNSGGTGSPGYGTKGGDLGSVLDDALGRRARFEIPKLPQPDVDNGTPWSDAKLSVLQRQFQDKRKA